MCAFSRFGVRCLVNIFAITPGVISTSKLNKINLTRLETAFKLWLLSQLGDSINQNWLAVMGELWEFLRDVLSGEGVAQLSVTLKD
jgi:hypothetical protein